MSENSVSFHRGAGVETATVVVAGKTTTIDLFDMYWKKKQTLVRNLSLWVLDGYVGWPKGMG